MFIIYKNAFLQEKKGGAVIYPNKNVFQVVKFSVYVCVFRITKIDMKFFLDGIHE